MDSKLQEVSNRHHQTIMAHINERAVEVNALKATIAKDALTLPVFRSVMAEVREQDTAFKEALCAQVHDTIDPFSNYTSALQRIFGELEQIKNGQAETAVAVAGAIANIISVQFGEPVRERPTGLIKASKKKPAGKAKKKNG
jgi:hypothetical protein